MIFRNSVSKSMETRTPVSSNQTLVSSAWTPRSSSEFWTPVSSSRTLVSTSKMPVPSNPTLATSYQSRVVAHKPRYPAGIQARHHQLDAQDRESDYKTKFVNPIIEALNFLRDKCIMCCLYHRNNDWEKHASDDCPKRFGTHYGDPDYVKFRKSAIRLSEGWCYMYFIHQVFSLVFYLLIFITEQVL